MRQNKEGNTYFRSKLQCPWSTFTEEHGLQADLLPGLSRVQPVSKEDIGKDWLKQRWWQSAVDSSRAKLRKTLHRSE